MSGQTKFSWATIIEREYRDVPEFWERDAGLVCLGLREIGVDARFVALGPPTWRDDLPLILADREQIEDPAWWRQWGLKGVNLWGWPLNDRISAAIKASGAKLVFHLDTDGLGSSHVDFRRYLIRSYHVAKDEGRFAPVLWALAKTLIFHTMPARYDSRVLRLFEYADLLPVNSPLAREQIRRFALKFGRPDIAERVKLIPSPAAPDARYAPDVPKKLQLVAAGRWAAYQKDAPLLIKVINQVLTAQPHWSATLCGGGGNYLKHLCKSLPNSVHERVHVLGYVNRSELIKLYQESSILLVPSRYESLHLPAVEALCCGTSVVGPAEITSISFLAGAASGTLAINRSVANLADALLAEIAAWETGQRFPVEISAYWRERFAAGRYASEIVEAVGLKTED